MQFLTRAYRYYIGSFDGLGREVWIHIAQGVLVSVACYYGLKHSGISGAAWGVFAGIAFSTPVMYYLATRCFPSRLGDLWRALAPGLGLNLILLAVLALADAALPADWREIRPALYMLVTGGCAAIAYAAAFLFLPLATLADESLRWRRTLRLAR